MERLNDHWKNLAHIRQTRDTDNPDPILQRSVFKATGSTVHDPADLDDLVDDIDHDPYEVWRF